MIAAYERSLKYTEHKLEKIRSRLEELPLGDAVVTDHQLALFLLNDIIRYYRTGAGLILSTPRMLESVNSGTQRGAGGHVGLIGATLPT